MGEVLICANLSKTSSRTKSFATKIKQCLPIEISSCHKMLSFSNSNLYETQFFWTRCFLGSRGGLKLSIQNVLKYENCNLNVKHFFLTWTRYSMGNGAGRSKFYLNMKSNYFLHSTICHVKRAFQSGAFICF
jgi:hypothetical protein